MSWRLAESLVTFREQVDKEWPNRSKVSDGSIGDPAHSSRESDHNPNELGIVCAIDVTHDPAKGADMKDVSEALRENKDPRIKYVIFQGRMFSSYSSSTFQAWIWRPYSGVNAHSQHMHLSVHGNYDNSAEWRLQEGGWFEMASKEDLRKIIREEIEKEVRRAQRELAVGKTQKSYDPDKVNLKGLHK